jgi:hypothetical protein
MREHRLDLVYDNELVVRAHAHDTIEAHRYERGLDVVRLDLAIQLEIEADALGLPGAFTTHSPNGPFRQGAVPSSRSSRECRRHDVYNKGTLSVNDYEWGTGVERGRRLTRGECWAADGSYSGSVGGTGIAGGAL